MRVRKVLLVLMILNVFVFVIGGSYQQASANVFTKPIMQAGKKALKEVATDSAVEMAEHILFEKMMNDFLNTEMVDDGYKPACLVNASSASECPDDKKVQIKESITASDKQNLGDRIENIIEQKTNTDTRVSKFIDFFVPLFLIGGITAYISAELDGDSQGLVNDMSLQALLELGIIKPLNFNATPMEVLDFTPFISSASARLIDIPTGFSRESPKVLLEFTTTKNLEMSFYAANQTIRRTFPANEKSAMAYTVDLGSSGYGDDRSGSLYLWSFTYNYVAGSNGSTVSIYPSIRLTETYKPGDEAELLEILTMQLRTVTSPFINNTSVNGTMNAFANASNSVGKIPLKFTGVTPLDTPQQKPLDTSALKPIQHSTYYINNILPAQEVIPIKTPEGERVYPKPDGQEWTDSTGRTKPDVIPDTLIVEDVQPVGTETPPTEPDEEEPVLACKRDLNRIEFKKVGNAFTNAFPFSIPWDIKRFIDGAFGGVGNEKPVVNLSFLGDGVTLTIPDYFDNWMGFVHGLIIIVFDVSLVYLFYRFMKGGGD